MSENAMVIPTEQSDEFADVKLGIEKQFKTFSELYDEIRKIVKIEKDEQIKFSDTHPSSINVFGGNKLIGKIKNGNYIFCSFSAHFHDMLGLPLFSLSPNFRLAVIDTYGDFDDWSWVKSNSLEYLRIGDVYYSKSARKELAVRSYDPEIEMCVQPLPDSIVYRMFNLYKQKMGMV